MKCPYCKKKIWFWQKCFPLKGAAKAIHAKCLTKMLENAMPFIDTIKESK